MKADWPIFLGALFITGSMACTISQPEFATATTSECTQHELVQLGGGQGVIFPAGVGHVEGYHSNAIKEIWTPTLADTRLAESQIESYLDLEAPSLVEKYRSYTRQYTGFNLEGRAFIFIQFFCTPPEDWRCGPAVVDDGGDCYFHLEYDIAEERCKNLYINGHA